MNLITDRTLRDVDRWWELHKKGWSSMTVSEQGEWLGQMKGRYNHTDLNRVESAVQRLSARLLELGHPHTPPVVKTDWVASDSPTRDDFDRYFGNVLLLRGLIPVYPNTPDAPTTNKNFDYIKANALEQILADIDKITEGISSTWCFAGELNSGEV